MITQCLQWRHQFEGIGIDGLYEELDPFDFPNRDQVFKYWPIYFHGVNAISPLIPASQNPQKTSTLER
jgi:hypothetical protein